MPHARLVLFMLLVLSMSAVAQTPDSLSATAQKIADQINADPKVPSELFAPAFLKAVPAAKLSALCKSLHQQAGAVTGITPQRGNTETDGKFTFHFADSDMPVSLTLETAAPHRVAGLWFGVLAPRLKSLDEVVAKLGKLPGQTGLLVQRIDGDQPQVLAQLNPDKPLAIGSTFKLYILATLIHDKVAWDKVVTLEDRYKSLPTGELRNWPAGAPVTVHTLASLMISQSDNTATDHLLALVTPERVAGLQVDFGLKDGKPGAPFLSTLEFFRLKCDATLRKNFLAAEPAARPGLLAAAATQPKPTVSQMDLTAPTAIDTVEWFASPADPARLMAHFHKINDKTALAILAINTGLSIPKEFSSTAFKGGSEPGVLSLTFLLKTPDDKAYVLTATTNNPAAPIDDQAFFSVIQSALPLVAKSK